MNSTQPRRVDLRIEVVVIPVFDVDRAKRFYGSSGRRSYRYAEPEDAGTGLSPLHPLRPRPHFRI
jgi:hypothetical protein